MGKRIEMVMLSMGGVIIILCKGNVERIVCGKVFKGGGRGVVGILGMGRMGDSFF
ncbi:anaerobic C4-dicarboxylate transporter family protein, partial [Bacillus thuringiensis]|uniref:anaerobic C4-dicarboxylate transporter family protein n=1 Tax=Bacillus thuringiensis TaxID=1428 RepID=UPI003BFA6876